MKKIVKSNSVPQQMLVKYEEITSLITSYCLAKLDQEYAELAQLATAALARKRPSPLIYGKPKTWSCAIVYAIGFANFLFDKSTQPYTTAAELATAFGISKSTAGNKAREVRELLNINHFDHKWLLRSRIDNSSMPWMISFNGFIVDARQLPHEIQEIAVEKGLIPHVYTDNL